MGRIVAVLPDLTLAGLGPEHRKLPRVAEYRLCGWDGFPIRIDKSK